MVTIGGGACEADRHECAASPVGDAEEPGMEGGDKRDDLGEQSRGGDFPTDQIASLQGDVDGGVVVPGDGEVAGDLDEVGEAPTASVDAVDAHAGGGVVAAGSPVFGLVSGEGVGEPGVDEQLPVADGGDQGEVGEAFAVAADVSGLLGGGDVAVAGVGQVVDGEGRVGQGGLSEKFELLGGEVGGSARGRRGCPAGGFR